MTKPSKKKLQPTEIKLDSLLKDENETSSLPAIRKVHISHPDNLMTRTREDGILETIDVATGNVISQSASPFLSNAIHSGTSLEKLLPQGFIEIEHNGQKIIMDQGMDLSKISGQNYQLSPVMKDLIFQKIAEGDSLFTLSKRKNYPPYSLLCKWYYKDQDFRNLVDTARKFRAEHIYDKIMSNVERLESEPMNKAEVDALTSATNFRKWAAEISNPEAYAHKKDANQGGVTIIVQTGIDRAEATTTIEVVPKKDLNTVTNETD